MRATLLLCLFALMACGEICEELPTYRYETIHGIKVITEGTNAPVKGLVEVWTQLTLDFWHGSLGTTPPVPKNVYAYFLEEDAVYDVEGNAYAGFAWRVTQDKCGVIFQKTEVSNGSIHKVRYVFMHELTHILFWKWDVLPRSGGQYDHQRMKDSGFNRTFGY